MNPTRNRLRKLAVSLAATSALIAVPAHATVPVIDVASIMQLIEQLNAWRAQLEGMQQQIGQLRQTYAAMTGSRGMAAVLPIAIAARNYLPTDWSTMDSVAAHAGDAYQGLAAAVSAAEAAHVVLPQAAVGRYSATLQSLLAADRHAVAGHDVLMRAAYAASSQRFAALQGLIDQIGATQDAKAIAELQGRIAAEQAMIANDGIKLLAAAQVALAGNATRDLERREQVIAYHGAFASRLQPQPPAP